MDMIETKLADQPEQFQEGEGPSAAWHVGRRVLHGPGWEVRSTAFPLKVLFETASGLRVFVDPSKLSPYPSTPIEEPTKWNNYPVGTHVVIRDGSEADGVEGFVADVCNDIAIVRRRGGRGFWPVVNASELEIAGQDEEPTK